MTLLVELEEQTGKSTFSDWNLLDLEVLMSKLQLKCSDSNIPPVGAFIEFLPDVARIPFRCEYSA